jgi:hypothetical protein
MTNPMNQVLSAATTAHRNRVEGASQRGSTSRSHSTTSFYRSSSASKIVVYEGPSNFDPFVQQTPASICKQMTISQSSTSEPGALLLPSHEFLLKDSREHSLYLMPIAQADPKLSALQSGLALSVMVRFGKKKSHYPVITASIESSGSVSFKFCFLTTEVPFNSYSSCVRYNPSTVFQTGINLNTWLSITLAPPCDLTVSK